MLDDLYRSVVMEHAKYKRNYGTLEGEGIQKVHYKNPTCGDVIVLYVQMEQNKIKQVAFEGEGCSISMASSSMMTELIQHREIKQVIEKRNQFEQLIRKGEQSDENVDLGDALSLQGVHKLRARHNCALMAWQALDKILDENEKEIGKGINQ